jgi:hypothetical protein
MKNVPEFKCLVRISGPKPDSIPMQFRIQCICDLDGLAEVAVRKTILIEHAPHLLEVSILLKVIGGVFYEGNSVHTHAYRFDNTTNYWKGSEVQRFCAFSLAHNKYPW